MVGLGLVMGSLTEAHFRFRFENDRHCSVFLILCFPTVQGTNNYSPELKVEAVEQLVLKQILEEVKSRWPLRKT
jgi:hypothetical protein